MNHYLFIDIQCITHASIQGNFFFWKGSYLYTQTVSTQDNFFWKGLHLHTRQITFGKELVREIGWVIWIFSRSTVWRVYRFLDTVLMDSDRYRCIFRSTTIVFEIIGISAPYSFPTISYRFRFREKDMKTKVIWPPIDRFRSFSSLLGCLVACHHFATAYSWPTGPHGTSTVEHGTTRHGTIRHGGLAVLCLIVPPCWHLGLGTALQPVSYAVSCL
jgi:hypothetical protein